MFVYDFRWDTREKGDKPKLSIEAHKESINCVDFHPFSEYLLLTGSKDKVSK